MSQHTEWVEISLCDECYEKETGLFAVCEDFCSLPLDHVGLCDARVERDEPCARCGERGRLTATEIEA